MNEDITRPFNGVYCFLNTGFPIIATGSRHNDLNGVDDDDLRYPLVHAILKQHEQADGKLEFYVGFHEIVSIPRNAPADYECPHVNKVRSELMKFVCDTYINKIKFKIDEEFYNVCDMSDTVIRSKYFLMPAV